jgi:hypothetical protein
MSIMKNGSPLRVLLLLPLTLAYGCAATQVALQYKDLDVQTKMSATIFLPPVSPDKKTLWVDVRNTSDKDLDLAPLSGLIAARGYRIVTNPDEANYRLQVNVLYVGKADPAAIEKSLYAGWGGPLAGTAAGAIAGAGIGRSPAGVGIGAGVGALVGGAAELISGSLVKKVTYTMITDVQLSEKSATPVAQTQVANVQQGTATSVNQTVAEQSGWRLYQTRVASTAVKVNLEFEEARSPLTQGLLRSLSGVL